MFQQERHQVIIDLINNEHRVKVLDLVERLKASEATIRRDLQELEEQGYLKRTHGGAMLEISSTLEPTFLEKEIAQLEEKKHIARLAASRVNDGDVIIMDSGTTVAEMVPFIATKQITVITNSVPVISALNYYENINLIVIGGQSRSVTRSVVGAFANQMILSLHADKAFIGTNAIDLKYGLTTPNIEEAKTKESLISISDEVYALIDDAKFNVVSLVKFAKLSDIDAVITNMETTESVLNTYKAEGIQFIQ